ncbi:MAG: response regulator transcription factor [Planctomycetes bacterium]|nr:response regulator transcription factor [Planctomycetota bacterium]
MAENDRNNRGRSKKQIMIVDDHAVVREGLTRLICAANGLDVCGGAQNAVEAMKILAAEPVDLVIMDISIEGMSGIQLTEKIKSLYPDLPVIMLTIHDDPVYARRAFRAGAGGYIAKDEASESVIKAIRRVLRGKSYISDRIVQQIIAARASR